MDELTPKQNEVLALMAKGLTNGRIAERLGISLAVAPVSDIGNRTIRVAVVAGHFSPIDADLVALDSAGRTLERISVAEPKPATGMRPSFGPRERFVAEGVRRRATATFETTDAYAEYAFFLRVEPAAATTLGLICGGARTEVPLDFRGEEQADFVVSPPAGSTVCHFEVDTTGGWRIQSK